MRMSALSKYNTEAIKLGDVAKEEGDVERT
jgi:hypothetical protein